MDPQQLSQYVDGELPPAARADLEARLAGDPELRRELAAQLQADGLLRVLMGGTEADGRVSASVRAVLESQRTAQFTRSVIAELRRPAAEPAGRRAPRLLVRALAAAAGLALVVVGGWRLLQRPAALDLQIVAVQGEAWVTRAGRAAPLSKDRELRDGDRLTLAPGGQATLRYAGENTQLELQAATATFRTIAGAKRVQLDAGRLLCAAAPQQHPFLLETPHAVAEVVGTRFGLDVAGAETTLMVQAGTVALIQSANRLEVMAGEAATAGAAGLARVATPDRSLWAWAGFGSSELGDATRNNQLVGLTSLGMPNDKRRADVNGDGVVNAVDLQLLILAFGRAVPEADPRADVNGDRVVNAQDLQLLLTSFGQAVRR